MGIGHSHTKLTLKPGYAPYPERWCAYKMKLLLHISILLLTSLSCFSQSVDSENLIGEWREGQSMLNGVPDTISRFAKYRTGESGYIYRFSEHNKMIIWDFNSKGRFNKRKTTWELSNKNNMSIIQVGDSKRYMIITKITKDEFWVTYPEDNIEKCMTFKRIK